MYRDKIIFGLMAVASFFVGCTDDLGVAGGPKHPVTEGDEIVFGAADLLTFADGFTDGIKGSRTVYGGNKFENGSWHYPLYWIQGDEVAVWSPLSTFPNDNGKGYAEYEIQWEDGTEGAVSDEYDKTYLVKIGSNGLHWGDVNKQDTIYAFYPASLIREDAKFGTDGKGYVHGNIEKMQNVISWEVVEDKNGAKHWIGKPDMSLAYMRAREFVTPANLEKGEGVSLHFSPLTTAVEVTIQGPEAGTSKEPVVQMLTLRGQDKNNTVKQSLVGEFAYSINDDKIINVTPNSANDNEVNIMLCAKQTNGELDEKNGTWAPITLNSGDKITVTAFLLPQIDKGEDADKREIDNLQVEVIGFNGGSRVKSFDGVQIPVRTKSQIVLPNYDLESGANNWMSRIPENVYISQLTIPGSTDAFSGEIIDDRSYEANAESDFTQILNIEQQFNKGVRAFEIGTDVYVNQVACGNNAQKTGITFESAINRIKNCLGSTEFAVVTVYFLKGASGNYDDWVRNLTSKVSGNSDILPFQNSLTVGEARGKILLMARTNGTESESNIQELAKNIPVIHGWNNMKDKWHMRGYDMTNSDVFYTVEDGDMRYQWRGTMNPKEAYTPPTSEKNWQYPAYGTNNAEFYVQEWKRVCPESGKYASVGHIDWGILGDGRIQWTESKEDKVSDVINFMTWTKSALKNATDGSKVFINSMGGFYIVSGDLLSSAAPHYETLNMSYGRTGDIAAYSDYINTKIFQHVMTVPYEQRGPVGIVYFNFAGVEGFDKFAMHGDYLLKTLIGNNFSFPLLGTSGK